MFSSRSFLAPLSLIALTAVLAGCSDPGADDAAAEPAVTSPAGADSALIAELPADIQASKKVSFGALWETPPVISVTTTDTSTPVGLAPDLAAAIGPVLGLSVEWKNMQWPAQLPGVQSGSVDALFGQVSATAERERSVVDLVPFYKATMGLLMLSGKTSGVTGLASMCGKKVGIPVGSIQGETIKKVSDASCAGDPIQPAEYQGATAAISAVKAGTIAAWMDTITSQQAAAKQSGSTFGVAEVPVSEFEAQYTTIAVGKDQPGLTKALLGALQKLVADGTYDKIMAKYDLQPAAVTAAELVANPVTKTEIGAKAAS